MDGRRAVVEDGIIATKNDSITYAGKRAHAPQLKAEKTLDGLGKVVAPGLVNCHTHVPMTIFRGIAEDQNLSSWLNETIWPLEAKLKPSDVYHGALLGCLEMIKNGITCFADMYFHENMVAKAVEKAGLRAVLAPGIIEAVDAEKGEEAFKDSVEFAQKFHEYANGRVGVRFGPHAVYTCSPDLLTEVRAMASKLNVGILIHLAESKEMAKLVRDKYGMAEVELLENLHFLKPDVLAAHCIHLSEKEMQIMAKRDVKVSYNPVANMKIALGVPKVRYLMSLGMTVGIGTDGPACNNALDMFEAMKVAALLQKTYCMDPSVLPAHRVLRMATVEGARALELEGIIGSLEEGKKADFIVVGFKKPHLTPVHDFYANMVYSAHASDVETVIVDGKILMERRAVKTLDEEEIMGKAEDTALDLLTR